MPHFSIFLLIWILVYIGKRSFSFFIFHWLFYWLFALLSVRFTIHSFCLLEQVTWNCSVLRTYWFWRVAALRIRRKRSVNARRLRIIVLYSFNLRLINSSIFPLCFIACNFLWWSELISLIIFLEKNFLLSIRSKKLGLPPFCNFLL